MFVSLTKESRKNHFYFPLLTFLTETGKEKNVAAVARRARSCLFSCSCSSSTSSVPPERKHQERRHPLRSSLSAPIGECRPRLRRRQVSDAGAAASVPLCPVRLFRLLFILLFLRRFSSGLRLPPDRGPPRSLWPPEGALGGAESPAAGRAEVREKRFSFCPSLFFFSLDVDLFFPFGFLSDLTPSSSPLLPANPSLSAKIGSTARTAPAS